ncbi:MAG: class I SAM-dependent methyltransferase [Myxococcota bacterium]|nr:class I SAM-dependent methyltransferase [Myxococcota bacterium]
MLDTWREISDLVVAYDPVTLARQPVLREQVVAQLRAQGQRRAARIVARWPARDGRLNDEFVDGVLLRAHHQLQRLSEEFRQGERTQRLLSPLLAVLRAAGVPPPYRVVDVGCGLGYVVRWLAAHGGLGPDVELLGCDYNATLVRRARALAEAEGLRCRFEVANAFALAEPATVFVSTGVIHHFRGPELHGFIEAQRRGPARAFLHSDIKPSYLAPLGAWLFHQARMREPLARHDGILSALRAHDAEALGRTATAACPDWSIGVLDGTRSAVPVLRVMQTLIGVEHSLRAGFERAVAGLAPRITWCGPA